MCKAAGLHGDSGELFQRSYHKASVYAPQVANYVYFNTHPTFVSQIMHISFKHTVHTGRHVYNSDGISLQILKCKRNIRLKMVASECDRSVWPVGVVTVCGHWVGH